VHCKSPILASPLINKGGGMLSDIWQIPQVTKSLLKQSLKDSKDAPVVLPSFDKAFPQEHKFPGKTASEVMAGCYSADGSCRSKITIVGCGSSYHVALLAEYLIETIARIPVEVAYASEYRYKHLLHHKGDVLIAISSSGETLDTLECLRALKKRCPSAADVLTVGFVNEADSSIAREADTFMSSAAGLEVGIASTKIFSAHAIAFVLLAISLGMKCGTFQQAECEKLLSSLKELPDLMQMVLEREAKLLREESTKRSLMIGECHLWDIGCQNVLANNFIFLGRGFNFPIAMEGAMKVKELAYIHAEGYPAAEMKHGPIALIDQFMPVVVIAPRTDPTYEKIKANIEEVQTRSGSLIVITEDHNLELEEFCEHVIKVPPTHEFLMPLIAVIPMQLLAYVMGMLRGHDVDNPRLLSKVHDT